MKLASKLTIKLFLIVSLFVSAAIADDGHMPGGGFTFDPTNPVVCSADDGHMPGGGVVCEETDSADDDGHMPGGGRIAPNDQKSEDSIFNFVRNYLFSMFG